MSKGTIEVKMDNSKSNNKNMNQKKPKKRKSHWVYVKIGTRIVDVKKVFISADEDLNHIQESSQVVTHTEEKRNKEVWNWASGGKSISGQKVTQNTKQTLTKFVYKNEPKVVQPRGRPANKVKSNLQPTLPKIVRSSPTPSPPARAPISSKKNNPLVRKNSLKKDASSPKKSNENFPERNPNSIKLNPINDNSLRGHKYKKIPKADKVKSRKTQRLGRHQEKYTDDNNSTKHQESGNGESMEKKELLDEGFASDFSAAGNSSMQDNTSGETTPSSDESKSTNYSSEDSNKDCKFRSNSVPHVGSKKNNRFQSSSHIIRLTNKFQIEADNTNNGNKQSSGFNERGKLFTLEMTEVVNLNLGNGIAVTQDNHEEEATSFDHVESLILSEAKKLREINIMSALDELRSEETLPIILQG